MHSSLVEEEGEVGGGEKKGFLPATSPIWLEVSCPGEWEKEQEGVPCNLRVVN